MLHTTNYFNTFIEVAEDCKNKVSAEPPLKEKKSMVRMQYELLKEQPYHFTSDDLLFELYVIKNRITDEDREIEREKLFAKGQACMRSSSLSKTYGFGIHFNDEAKMALYGVDSTEYDAYKQNSSITHLKAMRNARVKD